MVVINELDASVGDHTVSSVSFSSTINTSGSTELQNRTAKSPLSSFSEEEEHGQQEFDLLKNKHFCGSPLNEQQKQESGSFFPITSSSPIDFQSNPAARMTAAFDNSSRLSGNAGKYFPMKAPGRDFELTEPRSAFGFDYPKRGSSPLSPFRATFLSQNTFAKQPSESDRNDRFAEIRQMDRSFSGQISPPVKPTSQQQGPVSQKMPISGTNPKSMAYYHILQQLYHDGYDDLAGQLVGRIPMQMPGTMAPLNTLEQMMLEVQKSVIDTRHGRFDSNSESLSNASSSSLGGPTGHSVTLGGIVLPPPPNHEPTFDEDFDDRVAISEGSSGSPRSGIAAHSVGSDFDRKNDMSIVCKFGSVGSLPGQLNMPHGFCIGLNDQVVIADTNNHRISIFELTGNFLFCFGNRGVGEGQLYLPRKVAMLPPDVNSPSDQEPVFVICDRGAKRSRMQIFSLRGEFIRGIPITYIDIVSGLCTTQDRKIVVVDSVRSGVSILNEYGVLLYWFTCASEMTEPSDITVHNQEYYICDFKGHRVNVFNQHGCLIRKITSQQAKFPNGIDISDQGDVIVGDSHGNKFHVTLFSYKGQLLGDFDCPNLKVSRCCGLKITSKGKLVTLAKNNNHVLVLNSINVSQA